MKKFLIGLVCGVLLVVMAGVVLLFAVIRLAERRPAITADSTLVLRLEGELPEHPPVEIPLPVLESSAPVTVYEIWNLLERARTDPRIKAVVFEPRALGAGWAKLQEVRDALVKFRSSGKPLVAFLRWAGTREYYLATAADRIYLTHDDLLNLKGLRAEAIFLRRTLDKIGVKLEVEYAGKYKDANDAWTRTSMRPETREVLDSVLDQVYGHLVETIAASRKKAPEQVRAILDDGPFLGHQATAHGLADEILFEDQVFEQLKGRLKQEKLVKVSHRDYLRDLETEFSLDAAAPIAFVVGEGTILRGDGPLGEESALYSGSFTRLLRRVAEDGSVKGVILRIDSPGGDAIASDEILHEVRQLSRKKPMVVSMSDVAASGGYYIAMSGDPVLAYPNTFTGSIGVVFGKLNLRGLFDKLGVSREIMTRGRNADIDSSFGPMTEAGRRKLREGIDSVYGSFLQRVAEGRKRKVEEVAPLAEGRVWTGAQARQNGLVDELGGLERAVELVKRRARIPAGEKVRLVVYPRRRSILEYLFQRSEAVSLGSQWRRLLPEVDLRLWQQGGYMRVAPYRLKIE